MKENYYSTYHSYYDENRINLDKYANIIIDFGIKHTKVGYATETEPRKILPTPQLFRLSEYFESDREIISLRDYLIDKTEIKIKIEEFIHFILFHILHLQKKEREKYYVCLLVLDTSRELNEVYIPLIQYLLSFSIISSVKVLPAMALPIYTSGYSSGIVVDIGYTQGKVLPVDGGFLLQKYLSVENFGTLNLEKELNKALIKENSFNQASQINLFKHLTDLVCRAVFCPPRNLSPSNLSEADFKKLSNEYNLIDCYEGLTELRFSLLKRFELGELFFGDVDNDEFNIAYNLLKTIKELPCSLRPSLSKNIILSGGGTMTLGFYRRFKEEITHLIETRSELQLIKTLVNEINIHKLIYPRNCVVWLGGEFNFKLASILTNYDKLIYDELTFKNDDNPVYAHSISSLLEKLVI